MVFVPVADHWTSSVPSIGRSRIYRSSSNQSTCALLTWRRRSTVALVVSCGGCSGSVWFGPFAKGRPFPFCSLNTPVPLGWQTNPGIVPQCHAILQRRVSHDSPTTFRDLTYSGQISSGPGALLPMSLTFVSVTLARVMNESVSDSRLCFLMGDVTAGLRRSSKSSFHRLTTSPGEVSSSTRTVNSDGGALPNYSYSFKSLLLVKMTHKFLNIAHSFRQHHEKIISLFMCLCF